MNDNGNWKIFARMIDNNFKPNIKHDEENPFMVLYEQWKDFNQSGYHWATVIAILCNMKYFGLAIQLSNFLKLM